MNSGPLDFAGRALRKAGVELMKRRGLQGTWIDVGAHHGETTLQFAQANPGLCVYAFEPNLAAARELFGRSSNYFVIPMAIAEKEGTSELRVNACEAATSLLPFNETALRSWVGGNELSVTSVLTIPTIRLDTFLNHMKIQNVDFLKIDTQGMDLAVVKSAGARLRDIAKITLEVDIKPDRLYAGAPSKEDVVGFLNDAGFSLVDVEKQSQGQEENLTFIRADDRSRLDASGRFATGNGKLA
jgi:FkbM family methyltransferase